jgi:alpha-L-arabinofuranosidase B-like protein
VGTTNQYLRHFGFRVLMQTDDGSAIFRQDATFCARTGLTGTGVSFESTNFPGRFIRRRTLELWIDPTEDTAAYRSDATFNMVAPWTPLVDPGRRSFQANNFTGRYIHHRSGSGFIDPITSTSATADKQAATFQVIAALDGKAGCLSFRSVTSSTSYLRQSSAFRLVLQTDDGTAAFRSSASFCPRDGLIGSGVSFESSSTPGRFVRHRNFELWLDPQASDTLFRADSSFNVVAPWAP